VGLAEESQDAQRQCRALRDAVLSSDGDVAREHRLRFILRMTRLDLRSTEEAKSSTRPAPSLRSLRRRGRRAITAKSRARRAAAGRQVTPAGVRNFALMERRALPCVRTRWKCKATNATVARVVVQHGASFNAQEGRKRQRPHFIERHARPPFSAPGRSPSARPSPRKLGDPNRARSSPSASLDVERQGTGKSCCQPSSGSSPSHSRGVSGRWRPVGSPRT